MLDIYTRSRGTGLTDLPVLPAPIPRWLSNQLICDVLWIILGLVLLTGCTVPIQTDSYHLQPAILVVTTDTALIERACWDAVKYADGPTLGCYVPGSTPFIYCPPDNAEVCWHEIYLHHVLGMKH